MVEPDQPVPDLPAALLALRLERGMTQVELARLSGVSQAVISHVERGTRGLTWRSLCALLRGLDASLVLEPDGSVRLVSREHSPERL